MIEAIVLGPPHDSRRATTRDSVHDSYICAAYILTKLEAAQGVLQGMSYWAYTDLFEEPGPPPTPFHGGFGLLTREGIRKPAFFAYRYLHSLTGREVPSADPESLIAANASQTAALIWDWEYPAQNVSNRSFYTKVHPTTDSAPVELTFKSLARGRYRMTVQRTGFRSNDAYTAYLEMGAPKELDARQLEQLNAHTVDRPEVDRNVEIGRDGVFRVRVSMATRN